MWPVEMYVSGPFFMHTIKAKKNGNKNQKIKPSQEE
jgi:hypothetical protein